MIGILNCDARLQRQAHDYTLAELLEIRDEDTCIMAKKYNKKRINMETLCLLGSVRVSFINCEKIRILTVAPQSTRTYWA